MLHFDLSNRGAHLRRVDGALDLEAFDRQWSTIRNGQYQGVFVGGPANQEVERQGNIINSATEQRERPEHDFHEAAEAVQGF